MREKFILSDSRYIGGTNSPFRADNSKKMSEKRKYSKDFTLLFNHYIYYAKYKANLADSRCPPKKKGGLSKKKRLSVFEIQYIEKGISCLADTNNQKYFRGRKKSFSNMYFKFVTSRRKVHFKPWF